MITNILLALILAGMAAFAYVGWRLWVKVSATILDFVTPEKEGEPSPLAKAVDVGASMVARALVAQFKTSAMGQLSGDVRAEKAIQGDLALDIAGQNPLASALLGAFPHLSKTLRRNPGLLDLALPALAKLANRGGDGASQSNRSNGESNTPRFRLQ